MDDSQILTLLFQRSEKAITELSRKYGRLCMSIAMNVLHNREDAEECVSDTFLAVWERIPPERPHVLSAYISRIARNLSYTRLDYRSARKRDDRCQVCLGELEACFPSPFSVEDALESRQIRAALNAFLASLDRKSRIIFVRRYFYFDGCKEIGKITGLSQGAVHVRLCRMRAALKDLLCKEGIPL